jgi:hypothetical protein
MSPRPKPKKVKKRESDAALSDASFPLVTPKPQTKINA